MATDGTWVDGPEGERVWEEPPKPKRIRRKPRPKGAPPVPTTGRLPGPTPAQVWKKGLWRWDEDASGVRYKRLLTPEEKAEGDRKTTEKKEHRKLIAAALRALAGPLVSVEGEGARLRDDTLYLERPGSRGRIVAEIPRAKGGCVVVQGKTWRTDDGELIPYVGVHVRFEQYATVFRTRGNSFLHDELPGVIAAMQTELARLDAGDFDPPHVPEPEKSHEPTPGAPKLSEP